jgi:penicillin-binding protein 2
MNRAIAGQYPPGSIFKLVVSAAGLDSGKINESTSAECSGKYKLGGIVFGCTSAHGHVELIAAIAHSCNVFFYTIGGRIGVVDISRYARSFGLGEKTGVDLLEERPGFVPTQEWKRKKINEKWQKGDTLNLSIGQGYLLVTPLQIARIVAAFANGGYLVRPHLADKIGGIDTNNFESVEIGLSKSSIRSVKKGMRECVASGTGKRANVAGFTVSGKTGTAQTSKGVNHGWFAGFAPFDDPKIVVVVFDEFGGQHGGELPAEVAGEIFHKAAELKLL